MLSKIVFGFAVVTLLAANAERISKPPLGLPVKTKPGSPTTNNVKTTGIIGEFLPQNLTFVLSANNLPSQDIIGQVDPYVRAYANSKEKVEFEKFGSTDVVENNPNPEFNQVLWFIWKKGTQQKWSFKLRDKDSLRPDNPLGEAEVDVDKYVENREKLNVSLSMGGSLLIQKTTVLKIRLYGRNLPTLDTLGGKSDPFVKVYWMRGGKGEPIQFASTSVVDNVENVDWNETIEFPQYIKGTDQWWLFKVYDHDGITGNDDIGEALIEVDPYAEKRQTKIVKLGKDGKATLGITPV